MEYRSILMSVLVIGVAAAMLGAGTMAFFSDTEESTGNILRAGTIDIEVDGENPWMKTYSEELADMKPCEMREITFTINNVGTNPVNVSKHLEVVECRGGEHPESEWEEDPENTINDIDAVITYDLSVEVYNAGDELIWWQVIIHPEMHVKVSDIKCEDIPLGMIPVGGYMVVTQSYHMQPEVTNWAQGDVMEFDIEIYAEQLGGEYMPSVLLVPKHEAEGEWIIAWEKVFGEGDPDDWQGTYGFLTYNTTGPTFDYDFEAYGLKAGTKYCLIYYADPWPGNNPGALIACGTTDLDGDIVLSGSIDLGMDLPAPSDANHPDGAKIWLVTSSDYHSNTQTTGPMTAWNPDDYLFEFSLIKYDDTDA